MPSSFVKKTTGGPAGQVLTSCEESACTGVENTCLVTGWEEAERQLTHTTGAGTRTGGVEGKSKSPGVSKAPEASEMRRLGRWARTRLLGKLETHVEGNMLPGFVN